MLNKPKKNGVEYDYSKNTTPEKSQQQLRDEVKKTRGNHGRSDR